ncbi:DDE-type integrase/transposase/recombinase [Sapientia aquatica]|uniref:Transposase n=1 Tax=Sapientia aquatica TaxID=1549640 RepID=A0A4R5W1K0_9BURK|nr:DDE-type integrase/transposase/recombinase [Sapientia aquatica]TDK66005.1 transposase [Sapientia aquatica]
MSAAMIERLVATAQSARAAPKGAKGEIYAAACAELGISRNTLHRKLKDVAVTGRRKQRSDSGKTALTRDEAVLISAVLIEHMRKNGKRLKSVEETIDMLRANELIVGARTDMSTGEVVPLSTAAISRALRTYNLHPDQVLRPEPAIRLASKHPNHVWQIDASRCVLYYLRVAQGDKKAGLQVMTHHEFYANKPANLKKAMDDACWRYVVTDHTSGVIFVMYVTGGETGANLAEVLNTAMVAKDSDPFHGVPFMVMLDPGSANTGAVFKNLCHALQIRVQINKPHNPRAKGQVEKAQDMVERSFESGLRLFNVESYEQLNELAWRWMRHFNATAIHSRTGKTRYAGWMQIRPEQLRIAPPLEVLRELAVSAPQERIVSTYLTVQFRGAEWDVAKMPNVLVGQKLLICRNPWRADGAQAIGIGDDGHEVYFVLDRVEKNEYGFDVNAALIGDEYKRHADTPAQSARKEMEMLATGTESVRAAEAARKEMAKSKALPFGGRIDPFKRINDTPMPAYLPRLGEALKVTNPVQFDVPVLSATAAMLRIVQSIGRHLSEEEYAFISGRYADGVPEDQLDALIEMLLKPVAVPMAVGGGLRAV